MPWDNFDSQLLLPTSEACKDCREGPLTEHLVSN